MVDVSSVASSKDARAQLVVLTNCLTTSRTESLIEIFFGEVAPSFLTGGMPGVADEPFFLSAMVDGDDRE